MTTASTQLALGTVMSIARLLAEPRSFAARIQDLFALLHEAIPHRDARLTIWLNSARPGSIRQQYYSPQSSAQPWDDSLTRRVGLSKEPLQLVNPVMRGTVASTLPVPTQTYLGAAIRYDNRLWGVIELRVPGVDGLNIRDQELLLSILPLLAAAISAESSAPHHNGIEPAGDQMRFSPQLTPHQQALLASLGRELEAPLSLHQMLTMLLRWSLDSMGANAGSISLVDRERGEVELMLYQGYAPDTLTLLRGGGQKRRRNWNHGIIGRVARSSRAILLRDVGDDPEMLAERADIGAELAVPICIDGVAIAVLVFDSPHPNAFGDAELVFATALCERAAQPLRRAMRYQGLVETSTQLHQVFDSLPNGLALIDQAGNVLRSNRGWRELWGLHAPLTREASFNLVWDLLPHILPRISDPARLSDFLNDKQRDTRQLEFSVLLQHPTQELHILSVPTRDSFGQPTGYLWAVSDVTREREVDRLKNEFVSVVSHELRTPLTSILGYTELLREREFPPDERREFLETVFKQAEHLSKLVEELLVISRIEAGKVQLSCWQISLHQLLLDLASRLNAQVGERHGLVIDAPPNLPPVFIDRDKVRQVLLNLLNNAVKYSPSGGEIQLRVRTPDKLPADHPEGRWLLVSVRDQGIGIAPEELPRIWERFYRVDNSNTRQIGGTGLGLSITRSLVELHGGRIWAESMPGKGSIFYFTLPIATPELARRAELAALPFEL